MAAFHSDRLTDAAAGAAWINGRAGELAAEQAGEVSMTAGNTVQKIAEAVSGFIRSYE
jgi:NAD(P)H-hydrate repair Nnr-like enzyme with NAD(P)H-hydrate dehydratase domain